MTGTTVGKIALREDLHRGLLSSSSFFLAARASNSFFLAASRKNKNFWRNSTVSGSSSRFLLASSVLSRIIQCRGTCIFFGMIPGMSDSHLFRQSWNNAGPGPLGVRVSWIRSMKKIVRPLNTASMCGGERVCVLLAFVLVHVCGRFLFLVAGSGEE